MDLSIDHIRKIAKKHDIAKHPAYQQQLKEQLVVNRKKWFDKNLQKFEPSFSQEQIIFGSLLGDGYISRGAARSIHYSYQEHFGESQRMYQEQKRNHLHTLNFSIHGNYLRSKSHPYFNELRQFLYPENIKSLSESFLLKCTHLIFLLSLYLDDGSLTISYTYNRQAHTVHCHPSIILYTLNFTPTENHLLATHVNKANEVQHLLNSIAPYATEIPSIRYKICLQTNIQLKRQHFSHKFGKGVNIILRSSKRRKPYTADGIQTMITLKKKKMTDQDISKTLGPTYWSIVYKLKELRQLGSL